MFAYCGNNPVVFTDSQGTFFFTAIGAVIGAACGAVSAFIEEKTGDDFVASVCSGATSGAISGAAADVLLITGGSAGAITLTMAGAGAIGAVASNVVEAKITGEQVDFADTTTDVVWDSATGALFGYMGGPIKSQFGSIAKKGFLKTTVNIVQNEITDLGASFVEEILGNVISDLGRFTIEVFCSFFD